MLEPKPYPNNIQAFSITCRKCNQGRFEKKKKKTKRLAYLYLRNNTEIKPLHAPAPNSQLDQVEKCKVKQMLSPSRFSLRIRL